MAPGNPPIPPLRSENDEMKSAAKMARRAGGRFISTRKDQKDEAQTKSRLTLHGQFRPYNFTSVAFLPLSGSSIIRVWVTTSLWAPVVVST